MRLSAASYERTSAQSRRHVETLREALKSEQWDRTGSNPRRQIQEGEDLPPLSPAEL